jgi:hypothetical protein
MNEGMKRVGKVVEFGVAPFKYKENARDCAFITLECNGKKFITWGNDLKKKTETSNVKIGDSILLAHAGKLEFVVNGKKKHKSFFAIEILSEEEVFALSKQLDIKSNDDESTAKDSKRKLDSSSAGTAILPIAIALLLLIGMASMTSF